MVGFVAAGNDIAGIGSEWTKAKSDQLIEHKKDQEFEFSQTRIAGRTME